MNIEKLAAQAINNSSVESLKKCIEMLDKYAADYRDVITSIAIVYDAAKRMDLSPDDFLRQNVVLVNSDSARNEIKQFLTRNESDKRLSAFGYKFEELPDAKYVFSFFVPAGSPLKK